MQYVDWPELFWKHDIGGEEAILEDGGAGSYLAEALSMPFVGPGTDKGGSGSISTRLWSILKSMVVTVLKRRCWRDDPFEVR